jgi:hypothetical protein
VCLGAAELVDLERQRLAGLGGGLAELLDVGVADRRMASGKCLASSVARAVRCASSAANRVGSTIPVATVDARDMTGPRPASTVARTARAATWLWASMVAWADWVPRNQTAAGTAAKKSMPGMARARAKRGRRRPPGPALFLVFLVFFVFLGAFSAGVSKSSALRFFNPTLGMLGIFMLFRYPLSAMTIWAMRSPTPMVKDSLERFQQETNSCPW